MTKTKTTDPYALAADHGLTYSGDRDVRAGGLFYSTAEWRNGYADAVRVDDAESWGFRGAVHIDRLTVLIEAADVDATTAEALSDHGRSALDCCGQVAAFLEEPNEAVRVRMLIECAVLYGRYDPAQPAHVWDDRPQSEYVQTEPADDYFGPMALDGMTATRRVLEDNLLGYVAAEYLRSIS